MPVSKWKISDYAQKCELNESDPKDVKHLINLTEIFFPVMFVGIMNALLLMKLTTAGKNWHLCLKSLYYFQ